MLYRKTFWLNWKTETLVGNISNHTLRREHACVTGASENFV